ncbi:MAG: NAD(P)-dependent oxidoreductase [Saprospiraceae bacterium]|nr:NAD(P)-dependent oxidoreductase [Saprospiraceae bacterium]
MGVFDFIIHNAGTTKAENKAAYFDVNAGHTRRLAEAINAANVKPEMFLLVSSLASYGPTKGEQIITIQSPQKPVTSYGESKVEAENVLVQTADFPFVIVQPTAVYGARDRDIFVFIELVNRGFELYIGTRPQKLSFIHAQDLCDLMFLALQRGRSGSKYIGSDGKNYTSPDLGASVKSALGKKTFRLKIPLSIVGVVAGIAETIGKWRGKVPPLNREKMGELGAESWLCDASESFEQLGFKPKHDLFSGMKTTIDWYRQEKWLK